LRRPIENDQKIFDRLAQEEAWHHLDLADSLLVAEVVLDVADTPAPAGRPELAEVALRAPGGRLRCCRVLP
jgi:hypothetical protein